MLVFVSGCLPSQLEILNDIYLWGRGALWAVYAEIVDQISNWPDLAGQK